MLLRSRSCSVSLGTWMVIGVGPRPSVMSNRSNPVRRSLQSCVRSRTESSHSGTTMNTLVGCLAFLKERKETDSHFTTIVATDLATLLELSKARRLPPLQTRVAEMETSDRCRFLIRGETGTGKELLARAIHRLAVDAGGAQDAPFEVLHVAGMSADMLNDELFGHVRGAFTDAKSERAGRLELAHGGTLLIDEVGDLPDAAQLRLLRFLQDQRVARQGTGADRQLRVRVIAATWRNLDDEVQQHTFRLDLLHRLRAGSDLVLPPLRERHGAFDEVVPDLLRMLGHVASPLMARSARDALELHDWRGNVRELVGVLQQALAFADGETLRVEHLPTHLQRRYLSVPLHQRAPGFLWDAPLDRQRLRFESTRNGQSIRCNAHSMRPNFPPPPTKLAACSSSSPFSMTPRMSTGQ